MSEIMNVLTLVEPLKQSSRETAMALPTEFLEETRKALSTNDWTQVGALFRTGQFIGYNGEFLISGPYSVLRKGRRTELPTLIRGRCLPHEPLDHLGDFASELSGGPIEPLSTLLPVEIYQTRRKSPPFEGGDIRRPYANAGSACGPKFFLSLSKERGT